MEEFVLEDESHETDVYINGVSFRTGGSKIELHQVDEMGAWQTEAAQRREQLHLNGNK